MHFPPGVEESNNFAKHADGTFWLKHALISDGLFSLEAGILSVGCYMLAKAWNTTAAKIAAGFPWLYFAWVHFDAAFINFHYEWPGLFVRSARDILERLLGQ